MHSRQTSQIVDASPRLYGEISKCYDYAALEDTLLGAVARNIGAETSTLLHFQRDCDGFEIGHNLAQGVGSDVHNKYVSKFHRSDPVVLNRAHDDMSQTRTDALTDVYRLSDVCDQSAFEKTEYYNDFLKPSGIRHVLALAIKPQLLNNNMMVIIGFHRPLGMRDFGENALHRAINIAPIVGSTIARLTFKEKLAHYQLLTSDLKSVLQNTGYIILDDALQIQEISNCVKNNTYGNLPFLMQCISKTVSYFTKSGKRHLNVSYTCPDVERTSINENINFDISKTVSITGQPRYVVKIGFAHTDFAISKCAEEFGWTLRESEIVMKLAQGLTNAQISDSLMISVRTVENHLRSIYSKAEVTSRTQLLRQLLHSIPIQY